MQRALPPLNALRAFEAAARHSSLTKASAELNVTPGALSHQIRGLEELLGVTLFHRLPRAIALTDAGRQLYPGLQAGFAQIKQAVAALGAVGNDRVLVVSTPPGFTAKWLAPRLYRFMAAAPEIDARVSSTLANADFKTDGVDVAVRNLRVGTDMDPELSVEKLLDLYFLPVCSPAFRERHRLAAPADLARVPMIHDEQLFGQLDMPSWETWLEATGVTGVELNRGLRFNSADHALDAAIEGAGVLLAHGVLAHDDLRSGRLVAPFELVLPSRRAYHLVCLKSRERRPNIRAFRDWIRAEMACFDLARATVGIGRHASATRVKPLRQRAAE